ncbi:predicted protein [Chaetoceros tenuissimus]|uniref:Uncharacterized protein n=1 Tax=Chaetoceros tenuissimus TaxID=426638 RepID=A0AAD3H534_9STRA|nr:predicted protein [Chaetoceros tenuissimus]
MEVVALLAIVNQLKENEETDDIPLFDMESTNLDSLLNIDTLIEDSIRIGVSDGDTFSVYSLGNSAQEDSTTTSYSVFSTFDCNSIGNIDDTGLFEDFVQGEVTGIFKVLIDFTKQTVENDILHFKKKSKYENVLNIFSLTLGITLQHIDDFISAMIDVSAIRQGAMDKVIRTTNGQKKNRTINGFDGDLYFET